MEERTYMVVEQSRYFLGICIYKNKNYILARDFYDNDELDKLKSLIYKFDVNICFIDLSLSLAKYDSLNETGIEIKITKKWNTRNIKTVYENWEVATIALFKMGSLLNEIDEVHSFAINDKFIPELSPYKIGFLRRIGSFSNYGVYIVNERENMFIGFNCIKALNIFESKQHPNIFIKSKKTTNSLFNLIDHCMTKSGQNLLKFYISFPSTNVNSIEKRKDFVEFILRNKHENYISKCLKDCGFIDKDVQFATNTNKKEYFLKAKKCFDATELLIKILKPIFSFQFEFEMMLFDLIDYDGEFIFIKGVNNTLDKLKVAYEGLAEYLNEIGNRIKYEEGLLISIIYFPQVGYLVETNKETKWELKFALGNKFYYKNETMHDLDNEVGDIKTRINEIEVVEAEKITSKIFEVLPGLKNYLGKIDVINSLAVASRKNNFVRASLNENNDITLDGLRYLSGKYEQNIIIKNNLIITGPNGSGKSALMRSISHTIILNQIGSFVPCKEANLGIFDSIYVKFNGYENSSSFKCDLLQMESAIKNSTEKSLVLIDEFGKGTDVYDGVSLLISMIKNFDLPKIIISTHFQSFFRIESTKMEDTVFVAEKDDIIAENDPLLINDNIVKSSGKEFNFTNYEFKYMDVPEIHNYKIFDGVYYGQINVKLFKKHGFENDFIEKYEHNKKFINIKQKKANNLEWAQDIIAKFMLE